MRLLASALLMGAFLSGCTAAVSGYVSPNGSPTPTPSGGVSGTVGASGTVQTQSN